MTTSRLVRVFISSTFRDFIEERDELVKKIFPELRRRCKDRFVEILEVDLRWGITEEQSKSGETLRICLEEIDRCRPSAPVFFIGLLGERYGWIPPRDYFKQDVLEDENLGWVKEHIEGKSVTELEILHGVLRKHEMWDRAFFYFRNDGYEQRHWDSIARHHEGIVPPVTLQDFTNAKSDNPEADDAKQGELKREILSSSVSTPPRNYEIPAEMAERVLEDLWTAIDRVFPAESIPTELERQHLEHQAFGESRARGYVPRPGLYDELDAFLSTERGDGPGTKVITGKSGGGKSALIAAWMDSARDRMPERTFFHYIGGTPESSTARSVVIRLMETIRGWGVVTERVPDDFGEAMEVFPEWMAKAAGGQPGGLLLVLDALNQLEGNHDLSLWWLPKELPAGVRLIASTLPGISLNELKERGWMENALEVPPLEDREKRTIIENYLGIFRRTLELKHIDRLAEAEQTESPLFLKVVLDELRIRGRYEDLGDMISAMLDATDPVALFRQVLTHLEEFDRERPGLVRDALGYLAASRRGLTESELLQLLSDHEEPSTHPLPRSLWSPVYLALEESLVSRNGRLGFFHDFLRQAVIKSYLTDQEEIARIHGRLGDVAMAWNTEKFSPSLRDYGLGAGAIHLSNAGDGDRLWSLLNDEGYKRAQISHYGTVDETAWSYKRGIDFFASKEDEESEVRLFKTCIKTYEMIEAERSGIEAAFKEFRETPVDEPERFRRMINKAFLLDETRALLTCLTFLADEIIRRKENGGQISRADLDEFLNQLESRLQLEVDLPIYDGIEETLVQALSLEDWVRIAGVTKNKAERLNFAIKTCLNLHDRDKATSILDLYENDEEVMGGINIVFRHSIYEPKGQENLQRAFLDIEKIENERVKYKYLAQKLVTRWRMNDGTVMILTKDFANECRTLIKSTFENLKKCERQKDGENGDRAILENLALAAHLASEPKTLEEICEYFIRIVYSSERESILNMPSNSSESEEIREEKEFEKRKLQGSIDREINRFALRLFENGERINATEVINKIGGKPSEEIRLWTLDNEYCSKLIDEGIKKTEKYARRIDNVYKALIILKKRFVDEESISADLDEKIGEVIRTVKLLFNKIHEEESLYLFQKTLSFILELVDICKNTKNNYQKELIEFVLNNSSSFLSEERSRDKNIIEYNEIKDTLYRGIRFFLNEIKTEEASLLIRKIGNALDRVKMIRMIAEKNSKSLKDFIKTELHEVNQTISSWIAKKTTPNFYKTFDNINKSIIEAYIEIIRIEQELGYDDLVENKVFLINNLINKFPIKIINARSVINILSSIISKNNSSRDIEFVIKCGINSQSPIDYKKINKTIFSLELAIINYRINKKSPSAEFLNIINDELNEVPIPLPRLRLGLAVLADISCNDYLFESNFNKFSNSSENEIAGALEDDNLIADIYELGHGKGLEDIISRSKNQKYKDGCFFRIAEALLKDKNFPHALRLVECIQSVLLKYEINYAISSHPNLPREIVNNSIQFMLDIVSDENRYRDLDSERYEYLERQNLSVEIRNRQNKSQMKLSRAWCRYDDLVAWLPLTLITENRGAEAISIVRKNKDYFSSDEMHAFYLLSRQCVLKNDLETILKINDLIPSHPEQLEGSDLFNFYKIGVLISMAEILLHRKDFYNAANCFKFIINRFVENHHDQLSDYTFYDKKNVHLKRLFHVALDLYKLCFHFEYFFEIGLIDKTIDADSNFYFFEIFGIKSEIKSLLYNEILINIDNDIQKSNLARTWIIELHALIQLLNDKNSEDVILSEIDEIMSSCLERTPKDSQKLHDLICRDIFQFLVQKYDFALYHYNYFSNLMQEADARFLSVSYVGLDSPQSMYPWLLNSLRIYPWKQSIAITRLYDLIKFHFLHNDFQRVALLVEKCPELGLTPYFDKSGQLLNQSS
jgi:Domain of unknown function (DUF4062)